jgi:hypothetical protein
VRHALLQPKKRGHDWVEHARGRVHLHEIYMCNGNKRLSAKLILRSATLSRQRTAVKVFPNTIQKLLIRCPHLVKRSLKVVRRSVLSREVQGLLVIDLQSKSHKVERHRIKTKRFQKINY